MAQRLWFSPFEKRCAPCCRSRALRLETFQHRHRDPGRVPADAPTPDGTEDTVPSLQPPRAPPPPPDPPRAAGPKRAAVPNLGPAPAARPGLTRPGPARPTWSASRGRAATPCAPTMGRFGSARQCSPARSAEPSPGRGRGRPGGGSASARPAQPSGAGRRCAAATSGGSGTVSPATLPVRPAAG